MAHKHKIPYRLDERHAYRLEHATPIITEMREWLDQSLPQVPPKNATGKALHYLDQQWDKLTRYLDDGRLAIDNNLCENAIRPFVMGHIHRHDRATMRVITLL